MLNKNNTLDANSATQRQYWTDSSSIDLMMRKVVHTLRNIDVQQDAELERLETSSTDEELKNYIRGKLLARHRERREPYVELLSELRKHQPRLAVTA